MTAAIISPMVRSWNSGTLKSESVPTLKVICPESSEGLWSRTSEASCFGLASV